MRLLYQIDMQAGVDIDSLRQFLADTGLDGRTCQESLALALAAWKCHKTADALYVKLAPQWPTHRQAPIDRAILRLAYYETASGMTPGPVVANEAVELAKEYSGQNSPAFVNNLVDRMTKTPGLASEPAPVVEHVFEDAVAQDEAKKAKAWLDDAVEIEVEQVEDDDDEIRDRKPRRRPSDDPTDQ